MAFISFETQSTTLALLGSSDNVHADPGSAGKTTPRRKLLTEGFLSMKAGVMCKTHFSAVPLRKCSAKIPGACGSSTVCEINVPPCSAAAHWAFFSGFRLSTRKTFAADNSEVTA